MADETTISLAEKSNTVGTVEAESRARIFGMRVDIVARLTMVIVIAAIFVGLNWAVMSFIVEAFENDVAQMAADPPLSADNRLITTEVVMSLVGATVVQVGVVIVTIVSYLFPKRG